MSLCRVEITQEVLLTCLTHAFTTEGEEIMGLLLGDILEETPGFTVSRIWMAYPQIRTDRRKDRVETSPEQMARCSAHAERLSRETGQRTRVVGWYHSHPHITVLPSHVDVRTQAMYQLLDPGFVGLIFSVFNSDAGSKAGQVQITAFQSVPANHPQAAGGSSAMGQELASYSSEALAGLDTPTKMAIRASAAAMHEEHRDTMVRREVPLTVVAARSEAERGLHDLVVVHRILAMEEKEGFTAVQQQLTTPTATSITPQNTGGSTGSSTGPPTPQMQRTSISPTSSPTPARDVPPLAPAAALAQLHAASCYQQQLTQMIEAVLAPSLLNMSGLLKQQALHIAQLQMRSQELQALIQTRKQLITQESEALLLQQQQQQQQLQQQQQREAEAMSAVSAAHGPVPPAAAAAPAHPPQPEISFGMITNVSPAADPPVPHNHELPSHINLTPHTHAHTFPRGTSPSTDSSTRSLSSSARDGVPQSSSPSKQALHSASVGHVHHQHGPLASQIQAMLAPPVDAAAHLAGSVPRQQQQQAPQAVPSPQPTQVYHESSNPGHIHPGAAGGPQPASAPWQPTVESQQPVAYDAVRQALPVSYPVVLDIHEQEGTSQIPVVSYAQRNLQQGASQGGREAAGLAGLPSIASASERMSSLQLRPSGPPGGQVG